MEILTETVEQFVEKQVAYDRTKPNECRFKIGGKVVIAQIRKGLPGWDELEMWPYSNRDDIGGGAGMRVLKYFTKEPTAYTVTRYDEKKNVHFLTGDDKMEFECDLFVAGTFDGLPAKATDEEVLKLSRDVVGKKVTIKKLQPVAFIAEDVKVVQ